VGWLIFKVSAISYWLYPLQLVPGPYCVATVFGSFLYLQRIPRSYLNILGNGMRISYIPVYFRSNILIHNRAQMIHSYYK
jgi:hypothetical protein